MKEKLIKNLKNFAVRNSILFRYFSLFRLREKLCSSDFSFSQVTEVGKRELRKRFLRLRQRRSREMFPKFPFSY